ncbi:MAG TPA: glucose-6-phosphate isomerase [bacterium]|nr:glucose-6-phosphate isomerase [bacterium]
MNSRHKITLDLNNLFRPAIASGLPSLSGLEAPFSSAHQAITALKQTGQLPFSSLPEDSITLENVLTAAQQYRGVQNVVVLGIGGSALGTTSIYHALYGAQANLMRGRDADTPRLFVVDHVEPQTLTELFDLIKNDRNIFIVISKSGNTSETLAQYLLVKKYFGPDSLKNMFFITDPHKGFLHDLVVKHNYPSLPVPAGVGGRFSIFTPVGLFPLALCGVDIKVLLEGARHMELECRQSLLAQNPAGLIALATHSLQEQRLLTQVVMLPYADRLRYFSDWFAQLWGESLGKRFTVGGQEVFTGSTPIKSVGVTDQHSQLQLYLEGPKDKIIYFVEVGHFAQPGRLSDDRHDNDQIDFLAGKSLETLMASEKAATEECLRENNRPNATIKLSEINEFQLGQLYQLFMNVIPYLGTLLNINAFDQPAVERIKQFTFGLLDRKGFEAYKDKLKTAPKNKELLF